MDSSETTCFRLPITSSEVDCHFTIRLVNYSVPFLMLRPFVPHRAGTQTPNITLSQGAGPPWVNRMPLLSLR